MKIVILGAGHVGGSLAAILSQEKNDITLVDENEKSLQDHQRFSDLRTVVGHASHPDVLEQADIENADMLVALTDSDEANMMACQLAHTLFNVPTKIARVRAASYLEHPELFSDSAIPVDVLIHPEQLVSENISRLINYPGSFRVVEFARGRLLLVAVKAEEGAQLVGRHLHDITTELPEVTARIAAIYRNGSQMVIPSGDTVVEAGDEVFFIAAEDAVRSMIAALRKMEKPHRSVFIAGGGRIGTYLAQLLIRDYHVKIIDHNAHRTEKLAELLDGAVVLHGDATSEEIMIEENVDDIDVFCAVTNDDEDNVLAAMMAKHLGVRKSLALVNRPRYVDFIQQGSIDIAISPQQDSISALLRHIRKGDVEMAYSLRRGHAEAIELIAHGDAQSSQVVGREVGDVNLPAGVTIGAIVHGDEVLMAQHDITIRSGDHVILFLDNKGCIPKVEKLFQIGATFF